MDLVSMENEQENNLVYKLIRESKLNSKYKCFLISTALSVPRKMDTILMPIALGPSKDEKPLAGAVIFVHDLISRHGKGQDLSEVISGFVSHLFFKQSRSVLEIRNNSHQPHQSPEIEGV